MAITTTQKAIYSTSIIDTLKQHIQTKFNTKLHILCYQSLPSEVATSTLFKQQNPHSYYAPVTHASGDMHFLRVLENTVWQAGNFNIIEPSDGKPWEITDSPAILLCPVVGFDRHGNRIGMGKGCFDRWLTINRPHIDLIIGLAFSTQECESIPHEQHDIPLDAVITEKGFISCLNT